jgi:hypothetical protein
MALLLLDGCGVLPFDSAEGGLAQDDMQPPVDALGAPPQTSALEIHDRRHGQRTFAYTGAAQSFVVPRGVTAITVVATGGAGESDPSGPHEPHSHGGRGGRISAVLPVVSRERLAIYVGGNGSGISGGYNGGGDGGTDDNPFGRGGGGATDVREHGNGFASRILVAGGGGGAGADGNYTPPGESSGGAGGGLYADSGLWARRLRQVGRWRGWGLPECRRPRRSCRPELP